MKKRLIILTLLLGVFSLASAQENKKEEEKEAQADFILIYTQVKDHLTHEPMQNVKAELLMAADSSFVDSLKFWKSKRPTGGGHVYTLKQAGNYLLRVHADGYVAEYVPVDIRKPSKGQRTFQLPSIYLHKQPK